MPRTVTARFESEEAAERALAVVAAEVPLRDSAVIGAGPAGAMMLDSLQLSPEDRSSCERQLQGGGLLLVAQVATESRGEAVLRLLDGMRRQDEPEPAPAAPTAPPLVAGVTSSQAEIEERIPIVEEELRIGKREVVRGRSRVRTHIAEVPVREQVELLHEETQIERRPAGRRLSEEEVAQGGLLQERVIEIAEMREEAVITKEAFVREELVVTKSVHRRVEQIDETVRRTEVETERLQPASADASGGSPDSEVAR